MPFLVLGVLGFGAGALGLGPRQDRAHATFEGFELAGVVFVAQALLRGQGEQMYLPPWAIVVLWCLGILVLMFLAVVNIRQPGMPLVFAGLSLNFLVVAFSVGMPTWASAMGWIARGGQTTLGGHPFYVQAVFPWQVVLGDSIPLPFPGGHGLLFSVGDVLMLAGVVWFAAAIGRHFRTTSEPRELAEPGAPM